MTLFIIYFVNLTDHLKLKAAKLLAGINNGISFLIPPHIFLFDELL